MKGRKKKQSKLPLKKVIGLSGSNKIDIHPESGQLAYIASGTIVFYDIFQNTQSYLFNSNSSTFSSLCFDPSGRHLATGEGGCKQPELVVWDMTDRSPVKSMSSHRFGIDWLAFSPSGKHLVSIGNPQDKGLIVWDWARGRKIAANKLAKTVQCLTFTHDFLATGGESLIKVWGFKNDAPIPTPASTNAEVKCMASRNVELAELKDRSFIGLACAGEKMLALSSDGLLCQISKEKVLQKWLNMNSSGGKTLFAHGKLVLCGCREGIIRIIDGETLEYLCTLPRPSVFDLSALRVINQYMVSVYANNSIYVWDFQDIEQLKLIRSFFGHSGTIHSMQMCPKSTPEVTLVATASADKSVRFWDISYNSYLSKELFSIKEEVYVKCLSFSCDGNYIASGDSIGNLRVHDAEYGREVINLQAHDSEISCLCYSSLVPGERNLPVLLASGSRDRLIHLFDTDHGHFLTIDDHSSAIIDLCFVQQNGKQCLISIGLDKALIFRYIDESVHRYKQIKASKKLFFVCPHPVKECIVVGEDKDLKVYNTKTGKMIKNIDIDKPTDSYTKLVFDATGQFFACCSNDKYIRIIEFPTHKVMANFNLGDSANSLIFTPLNLIVACSEGCIFVWELFPEIVEVIKKKMKIEVKSWHNSLLPTWAQSNLHNIPDSQRPNTSIPFELAEDRVSPLEIDYEEAVTIDQPSERVSFPVTKSEYFNDEDFKINQYDDFEERDYEESKDSSGFEATGESIDKYLKKKESVEENCDDSYFDEEDLEKMKVRDEEITLRKEFKDESSEEDFEQDPDFDIEESLQRLKQRNSLSTSFLVQKKNSTRFSEGILLLKESLVMAKELIKESPTGDCASDVNEVKVLLNEVSAILGANQQEELLREYSERLIGIFDHAVDSRIKKS